MYFFLILLLALTFFFFYERYSFSNYTENARGSGDMNIPVNIDAPVLAKNKIEINAPVDSVWKKLTDITNWSKWQKAVTETVVKGAIQEGTQFDWKAGGLSFQSQIHTAKHHAAFGWTGTTIGASAIHNWRFQQKDSTTTVVIVEESLQGVFPNLFRKYFQDKLDKGVLNSLLELKSAVE